MNIYDFSRQYDIAPPFAPVHYKVRERTAAAHVFRVTRKGRKWTARKGETVTAPHRTRLGACLTMSAMLDRENDR